MRPRLVALLGAALVCAASASAQQAAEQYVPIGRSPGVSGVSTVTGTVESANAEAGRLTLKTDLGARELAVGDTTRIWLDRTARGESNQIATLRDCRPGSEAEVKLAADGHRAEWIKIRAPAP